MAVILKKRTKPPLCSSTQVTHPGSKKNTHDTPSESIPKLEGW